MLILRCCAASACGPSQVRARRGVVAVRAFLGPAQKRPPGCTAAPADPRPGVRVTLVTRDMATPYSGMLPGYVAGTYTRDDVHIDLPRLAAFASARLLHAEAVGIDTQVRTAIWSRRRR